MERFGPYFTSFTPTTVNITVILPTTVHAEGLETPRKEKNSRPYLQTDEYSRMLSLAGASPRDYAILQVFLQTGVRVSELCSLKLDDVDLEHGLLRVCG